ncbi:RT0821/Lpp0805 family surface protein, partial [Acinetobacter baumannii]
AAQKAYVAPIGDPVRWTNPANGHSGAITATRDGFTINGAYCREYQQTINVAERSHQAFGTACRQPTGTWKIVN